MSDFIWIIPSERQASLGNGGISPNYIIPQGQMNGNEGRLRGGVLWILLRGQEDRCIAVISIKSVEKFCEGYYANDFLVSCNTTLSFRLCSSYEEAKPYTLSDYQNYGAGTHKCNDSTVDRLKGFVSKTVQFKLAPPTDSNLKRLNFIVLPKKGISLAKAALSLITQSFSLNEVWASGTGEKLGPFSNFAARLLFLHGLGNSNFVYLLKKIEPTMLLTEKTSSTNNSNSESFTHPFQKSIDLDFTKIAPERIFAREFVTPTEYFLDLESSLSKTETAEKIHQNMLKDISIYLIGIGISPYESGSIDLMISLVAHTRIFEIKSTTQTNIVSQAAKGAFQLACYFNKMLAEFQPLDAALILHKINDTNLEIFVHKVLERLNVKCLTYDPGKNWPDRVIGLLN